MDSYKLTRVWNIDNKLVVASSVEEAIRLIKLYHQDDYFYEPCSITAVSNGHAVSDYDALIGEE